MLARALALWLLLVAPAAEAAEVVLVETPFEAPQSLVIVRDLETGRERRVAAIPHAPGWGVEASLSPSGRLLAASALEGGNRPWRHAAVYVVDLDSGAPPRRVLSESVLAAPVWTDRGAILAVRSTAEYDPPAEDAKRGRLLDMDLEVVQVAPEGSAAPKPLLKDRCNALDLVGALATGEVAVVRASFEGHALLGLGPTGSVRRIAELGPMAAARPRVTPDRLAVSFQQVVERRPGRVALSLVGANGERRDLARVPALFASPVPVGRLLAFTEGEAVQLLDREGAIARTAWRDPTALRLVPARASADGRWLLVERLPPEGPARTFAVELGTDRRLDLGGGDGRWRVAVGFRGLP